MLKNELQIEWLVIIGLCLMFFLLGYKMNSMRENEKGKNKNSGKSKQEKCQSSILTDSEFNTLLDETNYIE